MSRARDPDLQAPVYLADLASVSSKYIGETEKNLAKFLAHAEQAKVVLPEDAHTGTVKEA